MFDKFLKGLRKAELCLAGMLFIAALVVLTLNVIFRRVAWMPTLDWAEEFMRYCSVWITFVGMALCAEDDLHVGVDIAYQMSTTKIKKILKSISMVCAFLFCAVFTYASIKYVSMAATNMQRSPVLQWPLWTVYMALPIGAGLSTIQYALLSVKFLRIDHHELEEKQIEDASEINLLDLN